MSPRYGYGELRLGRLNLWAKILLRRFTFQKVQAHYGYNAYFARFYGPLLFLFAFFSVLLNAMQVALTANPLLIQKEPTGWHAFGAVCKWFSITVMVLAVGFFTVLLILLIFMTARETIFALRKVWKNRS